VVRHTPTFDFEREARLAGAKAVAGLDEAGRGPLAGPVTAAAVVFLDEEIPPGVADSKTLSETAREKIDAAIRASPHLIFAVAEASEQEIDKLNIYHASKLAMERALAALPRPADFALVDGKPFRSFAAPHRGIVKGDRYCVSIAAASVLAKVARDRIMLSLDQQYPHYGFAKHKGYPTPDHLEVLRRLGPCPAHRRSFGPVAQASLPGFG